MSNDGKQDRSLSEISHLFLSAVREKQTAGAPRPHRRPPTGTRRDATIDLTPDEFVRAFSGDILQAPHPTDEPAPQPRAQSASAVVATHLGERSIRAIKQY